MFLAFSEEPAMRIILVATALLIASAPALADSATTDALIANMIADANRTIAANAARKASREANQKALCDKLGSVRVGLNAEGVRKSCWGKPARINITQTASHTTEQWVYGSSYVYLTDGLVTAIQTSR
jgi:hypothetical protein